MIESIAEEQNVFHRDITTYINGAIHSHSDLYLSVFFPRVSFAIYAKKIIERYKQLLNEIPADSNPKLNIRVETYAGKNPHVRRMMSFLREQLKGDLIGAYIHGSLATGEQVAYSDFDALVIMKDDVFESPERLAGAARKLNHARTIMLNFDPLQHHGWFVLTEFDLKFYCNAYFPVELFQYAKSLFDDKGLELEIVLRESGSETRETFEKMANGIISKIANRRYPTNIYQLKGLLSEFMLLPALYLQAKNGRGVCKKDSFAAAQADFGSADWAIMDEVSEIRTNWNYEISPLKKRLMCHPHILSRYFAKRFGPQIPERIGSILTSEFYSRMAELASLMKEKMK